MARESRITREQVDAAAKAIEAKGGEATNRTVRGYLGGGSTAIISKYLKERRQEQQTSDATPLPEDLERTLTRAFNQAVKMQTAAQEQSIADLEDTLETSAAEAEHLQGQLLALTDRNERLTSENARLTGTTTRLDEEMAAVREDLRQKQAEVDRVRNDLVRSEQRLENLPNLQREVDELRAHLETERSLRKEAEKKVSVAEANQAQFQIRCDAAEARALRLETDSREALEKSARLQSEVDALTREVQQLSGARDSAQGDAARAREQGARLESEVERLKGDVQRLGIERDAAQADARRTSEQATQARAEASGLKDDVQRLSLERDTALADGRRSFEQVTQLRNDVEALKGDVQRVTAERNTAQGDAARYREEAAELRGRFGTAPAEGGVAKSQAAVPEA